MPEIICNTSPIQYLYQLELLSLLPSLASSVCVPPAVVDEIAVGRASGIALPDLTPLEWITVRRPLGEIVLPLVNDLGAGESEVLMLGLEMRNAVLVLDDALARRVAQTLGLQFTGTLGILLDAKRVGMIREVRPLLDQLQALRFWLAPQTRPAILELAGESEEHSDD